MTLKGLLPDVYYHHLCKLIVGISNLLRDKLTNEAIREADNLLTAFCREIAQLYGKLLSYYTCILTLNNIHCLLPGVTAQTANVHQLRHLAFHATNFGPLWCYSCFALEARNGDIKNLFHGTRNMSEQVHYTCCPGTMWYNDLYYR